MLVGLPEAEPASEQPLVVEDGRFRETSDCAQVLAKALALAL